MLREGVILAAGLGTRLQGVSGGRPKFVVRLGDLPLIAYPIAVLRSIGVTRISVVVPQGWGGEARRLLEQYGVDHCVVENSSIERENGYSLALALRCVENDSVIVSMCDHLYTPELPRRVVERFEEGYASLVVGGDRAPLHVDVDEATKILADDKGFIMAIGKGLRGFTHVDTGVFAMSRSVLRLANALAEGGGVLRLSEVVEYVGRTGMGAAVADVTGVPWTEVDTERDYYEVLNGSRRVVLEEVLKIVRGVIRA